MRRFVVALVLCTLGAAALAQAPTPSQPPVESPRVQSEQKPNNSPTSQKPPDARPGPVLPSLPPDKGPVASTKGDATAEKAGDGREEGASFWPPIFKREINFSDGIIAIFTLFLVFYTRELNRSTLKLWKAAEEQGADTKKAIAATQASADAAKRSADIAEKTLIITQRAYIGIDAVDCIPDGDVLLVRVRWKNTGQTQAERCRGYVRKEVLQAGKGASTINFNVAINHAPPTNIGPNTIMDANIIRFEPNEVHAAINGMADLYVWGWTEYNDVIDGTPRHRIEFCDRLIPIRTVGEAVVFQPRLDGPFNGTRDIPRSEEARNPGEEIPA